MEGKWFMDGVDLFKAYGVAIRMGTANFLEVPGRKEPTEHDWLDADGVDVDLSKTYLKKREAVLECVIVAKTEQEFFKQKEGFFAQLTQPGLRRLEFTAHGNKSYYVFYVETSNYKQDIPLKGGGPNKVVHQFSIHLIEPRPSFDASNIHLVTEDGRFLIV